MCGDFFIQPDHFIKVFQMVQMCTISCLKLNSKTNKNIRQGNTILEFKNTNRAIKSNSFDNLRRTEAF